jgi:hypothetical protein
MLRYCCEFPKFRNNNDPGDSQDNSLLNSSNIVKGVETIELKHAFLAANLTNMPAVYAIRCKTNNQHYIGESKNVKNRMMTHRAQLNSGQTNRRFFEDFFKYGVEAFELIIIAKNHPANCFVRRLALQGRVQKCLLEKGLCYNTGYNETLTPRPTGEFPTEPGIYCIRNKVTNARYYGETRQTRGLAGRISSWLHRLRHKTGTNALLQAEWNLYGADAFEFSVVASGIEWQNDEVRHARERQLVDQHVAEGFYAYNVAQKQGPHCKLSAKNWIIYAQSPEYRAFISALNTGRANVNRQAVCALGNVYLSLSEAERCLRISRRIIQQRVDSGQFSRATAQQVILEHERRRAMQDGPTVVTQQLATRPGVQRPVRIEGVVYPSVSAAAAARNVTPQAILRALRTNRVGYEYVASDSSIDA